MRPHTPAWLVAGAALLLSAASTLGQGTFANLNFEHPIPPLVPDGFGTVPIANALPGWAGYIGDIPQDRVGYNATSIGAAAITLLGPGSGYPSLEGSYFIRLQISFDGLTFPSIAQVGTVPRTALSIRIYAHSYNTPPILDFGGQQVPLTILGGSSSTYYTWGGDISSFAGQTGELRFLGDFSLDNILFSNLPVPEPGVFGLSALGALLLGWRVLGRRR